MSTNVAAASVVMSLDAQKLNQGLKKAANDSKKAGSEIAKNLKDSSKEKIGEIFGGGSVVGMFAKGGLIGAGVAVLASVGKDIFDATTKTREFHKELERGADLSKQWGEKITEQVTAITDSLREFDDIAGTQEGMKAYAKGLGQINGKLLDVEKSLQASRAAEEDLSSRWNSVDNFQDSLLGRLGEREAAAKAEVQQAKAKYDEVFKVKQAHQKKMNQLENGNSLDGKIAFRQFLKEQTDAVNDFNKSAADIKIDRFKEKFNWTAGQVMEARIAAIAVETQNAKKVIDEFESSLEEMRTGVQKTANEKQLEGFIKAGVDKAQIARYQTLIELEKKLNQKRDVLSPIQAGTWDAIKLERDTKFNTEKDKNVKAIQQQDKMIQELIKLNFNILGLNIKSPTI